MLKHSFIYQKFQHILQKTKQIPVSYVRINLYFSANVSKLWSQFIVCKTAKIGYENSKTWNYDLLITNLATWWQDHLPSWNFSSLLLWIFHRNLETFLPSSGRTSSLFVASGSSKSSQYCKLLLKACRYEKKLEIPFNNK